MYGVNGSRLETRWENAREGSSCKSKASALGGKEVEFEWRPAWVVGERLFIPSEGLYAHQSMVAAFFFKVLPSTYPKVPLHSVPSKDRWVKEEFGSLAGTGTRLAAVLAHAFAAH